MQTVRDHAFRPGLREVVPRLGALAGGTWVLLRVAAGVDVRVATVATVGSLGVMLALRVAWRAPHTRLVATEQALLVLSPESTRAIPWASIESVRISAGEVTTVRGVMRVAYALVVVTHGAPVAFADLAPLGSPRLRAVEADAPVHDVGDPELLLGAIAEHIDARAFLPPEGQRAEADRVGPWITASPLAMLRLGVCALVARALTPSIRTLDTPADALAGAITVLVALGLFHAARVRHSAHPETEAPAALLAGATAALTMNALVHGASTTPAAPWALVAVLIAALPVWPFPGAYAVRRVGRVFAALPDVIGAAVIAVLGVGAAWLYAFGYILLPTALVAGGLEAAEGAAASRRHARLSALPRFRNWHPVALAQLRGSLRPYAVGAPHTSLSGRDVVELRDASLPPPPDAITPLIALGVALFLASALLARTATSGDGRRALDVLLR